MITARDKANSLYRQHKNPPFTSIEALLERIKTMAFSGASRLYVQFSDQETFDKVFHELAYMGFALEDYDGKSRIIEVSWA